HCARQRDQQRNPVRRDPKSVVLRVPAAIAAPFQEPALAASAEWTVLAEARPAAAVRTAPVARLPLSLRSRLLRPPLTLRVVPAGCWCATADEVWWQGVGPNAADRAGWCR